MISKQVIYLSHCCPDILLPPLAQTARSTASSHPVTLSSMFAGGKGVGGGGDRKGGAT